MNAALVEDEAELVAIARDMRTVAVVGRTNQVVALSGRFAPRALLRLIAAKISLRYVGLPPMPPRRPAP